MKPQTSNLLRTVFCPLLAAFLWGSTFVAQGVAAETVPPFTFNAMRSWLGALFLYIISLYISKHSPVPADARPRYRRDLLVGGLCCGLMLAIASNLQQFGMSDTDPGKAGFITSLYVVLVPVFGLFCNRRAPLTVWVGIAIALVGLYLLCLTDALTVAPSDAVILLCAIFFAVQILFLDRFTPKVNSIHLSCAQLIVNAAVSTVLMFVFERPDWNAVLACWLPIAYAGILSSGIAYTLQTISLKGSNPTTVTLLLSLESVFSVLTGMAFGDVMTLREWIGCLLMFGAVTLANLPVPTKKLTKL